MSDATSTNPKIIVSGDIVREIHVYQGSRTSASGEVLAGTRMNTEWGGASLLQAILHAARPGVSELGLKIDAAAPWPAHLNVHATYEASASGFKADPPLPPGRKPEKVWRVAHAPGYGYDATVPPDEPPVTRRALEHRPDVLVIDDGGAGFRTLRAKDRWPDAGALDAGLPPWVVLKMSHPLCEGHLWRHLLAKCGPASNVGSSQLVVVASADELRRDGAAINRGLSWERTIADTYQALIEHPRLSTLRKAAHLFILFRREGVLWMRSSGDGSWSTPAGTLVIDPCLAEGQWKAMLNEERNVIFGHLSVFTAAIALELAAGRTAGAPFQEGLLEAIQRGLAAARELRLRGHGTVSKKAAPAPAFPFQEIAAVLSGAPPARAGHQPQDKFVEVALPCGKGSTSLDAGWTIAAQNDPRGVHTPLYGLGFQTAIYGSRRLSGIPQARFGALLTVDRAEIETLRGLRQMIQAYESGGRQKRPLCLGAFGPPGAGKSFGIEQIAKEILGKDVPLLVFNLAQFNDPADLIGAFHQVRDEVLGGRTPVVFWDEFDAANLRWLQFLLGPMQDGTFQSGQITHTLGKCIFVFAGATSWDFEHFGPAPEPLTSPEKVLLEGLLRDSPDFQTARKKAQADFRLKKGPDFLSRLNGHINVLGPNRRRLFNFVTGEWDLPDEKDITFPVRRALLLRSFLKAKEDETLEIDRDLLNALLRQPRYRHGSRSMEKVVEPLRVAYAPLRPAQLPPPQVLGQHLDPPEEFERLVHENAAFLTPENLQALAAAIHENYRRLTDNAYIPDPDFLETFDKLDAWGQATNLAAASGIPHVLAVAGLCVVPDRASPGEAAEVKDRLQRYLDPLRREEHARWMSYVFSNGWLQSPIKDSITGKSVRDKPRLLHTCLIPFDDLDEADKEKDDRAILTLPETVALVNFKIARFEDLVR